MTYHGDTLSAADPYGWFRAMGESARAALLGPVESMSYEVLGIFVMADSRRRWVARAPRRAVAKEPDGRRVVLGTRPQTWGGTSGEV